MNRRITSWSALPQELLSAIAGRLETRSDILQFRAVCPTWRRSASSALMTKKNFLSTILPHKISTPTPPLLNSKSISYKTHGDISGHYLILVASSVCLVRSVKNPELPPWLITVEEFSPGKLYLRQPLSRINIEELPGSFPKKLCLSDYRVSKIGSLCTLRYADNWREMFQRKFWRHLNNKVVLFVDPRCRGSPTIGDCTAMVLYNTGTLSAIRLKNEEERHLGFKGRKFDDIVSFKGKIYVVDRCGRLYVMAYDSLHLINFIDEILGDGSKKDRKKRLFELRGELYLVHRDESHDSLSFDVYRMNEELREWDEVDGIGHGNVLFVTSDGCFVASAKDLPGWRGNCIVLYRDTFPPYNSPSLDYLFGYKGSIALYPRYADFFFPPLAWLSADRGLDKGVFGNDQEELRRDTSRQIAQVCRNSLQVAENVQSFQQDVAQEDNRELPGQTNVHTVSSTSSLQGFANGSSTKSSKKKDVGSNVQTLPNITPSVEIGANRVIPEKFQGLYVRSSSVPILRKIWEKHGNIIPRHVVHNNCVVAQALESLVEMINTLQSVSGMSLNAYQAAYLNSTLLHLQFMHFRLDWLVPFVHNALAHYSSQQRIQISIIELETRKSKLLAHLSETEHRLIEQKKLSLSVSTPPDLTKVLS